jgi:hypothetical protein
MSVVCMHQQEGEMSDIGCGSHSCRIARPVGMGTNGPCTCWKRVLPLEREVKRLRGALRKIMTDTTFNYEKDVQEMLHVAKEALGEDE